MECDDSLRPLDDAAIASALGNIEGWTYRPERGAVFLHLEMRDFADAFGLMSEIAIMAERADHHPEWANVYNHIDIWLTTHDVSGVSARDLAMARQISDTVARRR